MSSLNTKRGKKAVFGASPSDPKKPRTSAAFGTLHWAASKLDTGHRGFVELLRQAAELGNIECRNFVEAWDLMDEEEREKPRSLDKLAKDLGSQKDVLVGRVAQMAFRYSGDVSRFMAAVAQPAVVETLIECAKTPEAEFNRDRKLFLESTRFAPTHVGTQTRVQVNNQINNTQESGADGLPEFETSVQETSRLIRGEVE